MPKDYGMGEQIHGSGVAVVNQGAIGKVIPAVDALITR